MAVACPSLCSGSELKATRRRSQGAALLFWLATGADMPHICRTVQADRAAQAAGLGCWRSCLAGHHKAAVRLSWGKCPSQSCTGCRCSSLGCYRSAGLSLWVAVSTKRQPKRRMILSLFISL